MHVTDLLGPTLDASSCLPGSDSSTPLHAAAALASRLPFAIEMLTLRLTLYFDNHRPQGLDSRNEDWPAEVWFQGYHGGIVSALVEGKKSGRVGRLDTLALKTAAEWSEIGEGAIGVARAAGIEVDKRMDRFIKGAQFG